MQQASSGHWARARRRAQQRYLARARTRAEQMPRVGDTVGDFLLEARLGAGSFGTVFRARRGGQVFALKLFYLPITGTWAWRELEVALRLNHVGLLGVECHGHHGAQPGVGPLFLYLVTDYVSGLPMDAWAEHTNPTARQVVRAVLELTEQLRLAHSAGVVHRDLKPSNVVVRAQDGRPVLLDFGAGTFPGAMKVTDGPPPGSPLTRPPEVWRFRRERRPGDRYEASPRDDLWALGVLLYWLLVGDWPFEVDREEDLEDAVMHAQPRAPHERNPRAPESLSAVCLRMLEKQPEARYAAAGAVGEALNAALEGADASWDVPLCEAWEESWATTWGEGKCSLGALVARARRLDDAERARPRRGRQRPSEAAVPLVPPEARAGEEAVMLEVSSVRRERVGRRRGGVWVALALLCAALVCPLSDSRREDSPGPDALPGGAATPVSLVAWRVAGQEMAARECTPEGEGSAAPPWAPTPAPVAFATHSQDGQRVKTSRKNAPSAVSKAVCAGALGALVTGCSGAQVRADPKPEACPAGAVEAMRKLKVRINSGHTCSFVGVPTVATRDSLVIIREGNASLTIDENSGQLKEGTLLVGRFIFGKERVWVRFTEAYEPGGATYPVCMEIEDVGTGAYGGRGLFMEPGAAPGTAHVSLHPRVVPVVRFK